MADVRRVISIEAKIAQSAISQIKEMEKSLGGLEKSASSALTAMKGFVGGLAGAITVGTVITAFKSLVDTLDNLNDTSERLGVSTDNLQAWGFAAQMSGTDAETLNKAIGKLSVAMDSFDEKSAKSTRALQAFGVTAEDVSQGTDAVFTKLAEGFSKMPDGAQKTAKAIELFGKEGAKLIPLLNSGADGLEEFKKQAEAMGLVIDGHTIKAAAALNDQIDLMGKRVQSAGLHIVQGLLPALNQLFDSLGDANSQAEAFRETGKQIGEIILWIAGTTIKGVATLKAFGRTLTMIGDAASAIVHGNFGDLSGIFSTYVADVDKLGQAANLSLITLANPARDVSDIIGKGLADASKKGGGAVDDFGGKASGAAQKVSDFDRRLKSLNEELFKASQPETAETAVGKLTYDIEQGIIKVTKAEADQLMMTAELIDAINRDVEAEKARKQALEDSTKAYQDQITAQAQFLEQAKSGTQAGQLEAAIDNWYRLEQIIAQTGDTSLAAAQALAGAKQKVDELINGKTTDGFEQLLSAIDGYGKQVAGTLINAVDSTKSFGDAFGDMVTGVLRDLAQMTLQILIVQPLIDSMKASLKSMQAGGGGGFGGFLSALFSVDGNAFVGGVHAFAAGGILGPHGGLTPGPILFPFAKGIGLAGEAGTEAIMPLARGPDGKLGVTNNGDKGPSVQVNVINNSDSQASVTERQSANGDRVIDVLIDKRVRSGLSSGAYDNALQQSFGLTRKGR
ncbi:phage tail tape measure protein [Cupriavidus sp. AcVe19-6a]|uniref:phage tail tape measure protein n=1 Tax=Cupriavidus sp. AcVe19-6a TaxID=2821358 RepID=UPI001AE38F70|nr:phage tail tape measure protein [Cupriavidus sp. AcVe19-6a]MBP0634913.1 phage tail tape measure protein [Cupriavidus sp. AcVe19-6a]